MSTQQDQNSSNIVRTRFAPSPSGHLHVGGARTALLNWAYANHPERQGKFVLRIEDTDQKRSSDAASSGFLADLNWLGIMWDEGPEYGKSGGGDCGPYFQSQRLDIYQKHFDQLLASGKAYRAFDTAEDLNAKRKIARQDKKRYRYDRAALQLSEEEIQHNLDEKVPSVIRLKVPHRPVTIHDAVLGDVVVPAEEIDDFIICKADGFPTYHFAVVVDDETMGVTHVLRAQEHLKNTAKHILLQETLGFRTLVYAHLSVLVNPDNSKMSKRDKDKVLRKTIRAEQIEAPPEDTISIDVFDAWLKDKDVQLSLDDAQSLADALGVTLPEINVDDFRRSGYLPSALCNFLALNGWSPGGDIEQFDNQFLAKQFDFSRVIKTPAKFDRVKLLSFNHDAIQALSEREFIEQLREFGSTYYSGYLTHFTDEQFILFATINQRRSKTLRDPFTDGTYFLLVDEQIEFQNTKNIRKAMRKGGEHLPAIRELLAACAGAFDVDTLESTLSDYITDHCNGNLGIIAQPLRVAITGATVSPPIFETLTLLGKKSVLNRIDRCITHFED